MESKFWSKVQEICEANNLKLILSNSSYHSATYEIDKWKRLNLFGIRAENSLFQLDFECLSSPKVKREFISDVFYLRASTSSGDYDDFEEILTSLNLNAKRAKNFMDSFLDIARAKEELEAYFKTVKFSDVEFIKTEGNKHIFSK